MGILKGFEVKRVYDEKGNPIGKDGKKQEETPEPLAVQKRQAREQEHKTNVNSTGSSKVDNSGAAAREKIKLEDGELPESY